MIRREVEAADVKEDELERQLEEREYGIAMSAPSIQSQQPSPAYQQQAGTYTAPSTMYKASTYGSAYSTPQTYKQANESIMPLQMLQLEDYLNEVDYDKAIHELD